MAISIRARFRNAMIGLSLTLCLIFTLLLFLLVFTIEDQVFENQLAAEKRDFEQHQLLSPESDWKPNNKRFQLVFSVGEFPDTIPQSDRNNISEATGIHEYFDSEHAYFISHFKSPSKTASAFLIYDVSDFLAVRGNKLNIFIPILILTLIMIAGSVFVSHRLVNRTLEPVRRLSNELQQGELDDVVIKLANQFSEDEIGILTHELALALGRVRDAAQREYEFNRGVSHELRSPIQVARSAIELLELRTETNNPKDREFVARLKRAVNEMNQIAEAFLWLASDRDIGPSDVCSVEAVNDTTATVQAMFPASKIVVDTSLSAKFTFPLPENIGAVVVRNLLRNAMSHGENEPITLLLTEHEISVRNRTNQQAEFEQGFGIGLSIVRRICERFECELLTDLSPDGTHKASIDFKT